MDYIAAYEKVIETSGGQIDIINFIDNKLSDLDANTIELERQSQELRELIEMIKKLQIMYLKDLNVFEEETKELNRLKQ